MADDGRRGKKLLNSERARGRSYDLFDAIDRHELHVDGSIGAALGPSVSRLDFHRVGEVREGEGFEGEPLEIRERSVTVIMPTPQMIEFLVNTLNVIMLNRASLTQSMRTQADAVDTLLSSIGANDAAKH